MAVFMCVLATFMLVIAFGLLGFTKISSLYGFLMITGALVLYIIAFVINDTDKSMS